MVKAHLSRLVDRGEHFDAMVLDVMLPGKSGFEVAAALREKKNFVPILMLTARGRAEDVLKGFASGADDYLAKPFELAILIARLDGLLRRTAWMKQSAPPEQTRWLRCRVRSLQRPKRRGIRFNLQANPSISASSNYPAWGIRST